MLCRHDYVIKGKTSAFSGSGLDVLGFDWQRNFFKKEMASLFRSPDSFPLQNNVYHHRQTTELSVFGP